jgi:hypothetical protein
MPSLEAQTLSDSAADIRRSAAQQVDAAIKGLPDALNRLRQQVLGLFGGAEWADLRALLDRPDRWPFRSEFGAETALVGADVRLAVGHAIARLFLRPADAMAKMGMPADPGDNAADPEAVLRESPSLLWAYWTLALQAVADRLDEEAKRIDADDERGPFGFQPPPGTP